jgi:hypothetical protein
VNNNETPSLIIHVYDGHGYGERLRIQMEQNANASGVQLPGYKATGLTLHPHASPLLRDATVAAVRGDEQGFHVFVIPKEWHKETMADLKPGDRVLITNERAGYFGQTGKLVRIGPTGCFYVLHADGNEICHPWGVTRLQSEDEDGSNG